MSKLKVGSVAATAALAGALFLTTQGADAHHADVAVVCLAAPATIRVTAVAWDAPTADGRVNNAIVITFDGAVTFTGSFNAANGYTFSTDFVAPVATGTHVVRATAASGWGPDASIDIGEFREATIALPCGPPPSTTTSLPAAPTTTVLPVEVLGTTVTRPPDIAVPVDVLPRFAG